MPTYFGPKPSALIASATSLASSSARVLGLPNFAQASHSHHPLPSLGSMEMLSALGRRFTFSTAQLTTNLRSSGLEMQNLMSPPLSLRSPLTSASHSGCFSKSGLCDARMLSYAWPLLSSKPCAMRLRAHHCL